MAGQDQKREQKASHGETEGLPRGKLVEEDFALSREELDLLREIMKRAMYLEKNKFLIHEDERRKLEREYDERCRWLWEIRNQDYMLD